MVCGIYDTTSTVNGRVEITICSSEETWPKESANRFNFICSPSVSIFGVPVPSSPPLVCLLLGFKEFEGNKETEWRYLVKEFLH